MTCCILKFPLTFYIRVADFGIQYYLSASEQRCVQFGILPCDRFQYQMSEEVQ